MSKSFGRLFIADQKEAVVCHWEIKNSELLLTPHDSTIETWAIDLKQTDLTLAGFNQDQIVLKQDRLTYYVTRAEIEQSLRSTHIQRITQSLGKESIRVKRDVHMSYVWLGVFLTVALLLLSLAWWVTERAVHGAVAMTPASWDVELGKAAWKAQSVGASEITDPAVTEPVGKLVRTLTTPYQNQGFDFQLHVVEDEQINAFAMPGGQMIVNTGLLKHADGPDEVAGVLAHEVQHVIQRHSIRNIYAQLRWQMALAVLVGDGSSLHGTLMSSGVALAGLSYDRGMESEADREGVLLLQKVNLPDHGMVSFFKKLEKQQGTGEKYLKYISTHPSSADRVSALQKFMKPAPTQTSVPNDWKALQAALAKGTKDASRGSK
jgi:Zn-dependent protease with chaperone function